jgi:hypothetical protein
MKKLGDAIVFIVGRDEEGLSLLTVKRGTDDQKKKEGSSMMPIG